MFGRATIRLGVGPHSSLHSFHLSLRAFSLPIHVHIFILCYLVLYVGLFYYSISDFLFIFTNCQCERSYVYAL